MDIPNSIDWRLKGAVTKVKDQGQCNSSWAFAAIGAIESLYFIKTGKLIEFSEQELIDCSQYNQGCDDGSIYLAFKYIVENGISLEAEYQYIGQNKICQSFLGNKIFPISGFKNIVSGDENALKIAVAQQPVVAKIESSQKGFQFYSKGIMNAECDIDLNHSVLIVGYGSENGEDYWIVKNSWGLQWGEDGYIRIQRGYNKCGISMNAVYPV
jgi:C1A family cysteine protease